MSILIKGMEMPRDCEECRFCEVIDGLGCMATHYLILRRHGQDKPNWCPLVAVPTPHGRLIDADALQQSIGSYNPVKYTYEYGDVITVADIDNAPSIIEAEEGEEA